MVVPDLLATAKAAEVRSMLLSASWIVAGFTVSNTFSAGVVSGNKLLRTSGVRLLPPMPRMFSEVMLESGVGVGLIKLLGPPLSFGHFPR